MKIREATILDISVMAEEGIKFLKFLYPDKQPDIVGLYDKLKYMISEHVVYVAEIDGKFAGAIGGLILPNFWWSRELDLTELFWWVTPEHRGSTAGYRLLQRFIKHGKDDLRIERVIMTRESISPICEDVFTKRGFKLKEQNFVMEV
jgi:RimJ/RimL family protein N-acetyltransferase